MSKLTVFMSVNFVLSFLITAINLTIIIVMLKHSKLIRSVSNKILLSLVCADFLSGISLIFHVISAVVTRFTRPSLPSDYVYRITVDLISLSLQLSAIGNLCFIIFERYIVLCHTYSMHRYINKTNVKYILITIWLMAVLFPCIQLIWLHHLFKIDFDEHHLNFVEKADSIFSAISILLFVIIPIILLLVALARMFGVIRKFPHEKKSTKRKDESTVLRLFSTMYLTFVIFCLPYFSLRLIIDLQPLPSVEIPGNLMEAVFVMKYLPPFLNPFIYVLNKPEFRRLFRSTKYDNLKRTLAGKFHVVSKLKMQTKNKDCLGVLIDDHSTDSNMGKLADPILMLSLNAVLSDSNNNKAHQDVL